MKPVRISSMVLAAGLLFVAGNAVADVLNEETDFGLPQFYGRGKNVSVMERPRPDYDATGLHVGGFTVLPKLDLGAIYTDNLFAVDGSSTLPSPFNGKKSDLGSYINPSIQAQSNWGRHSLTALASVKDETFAEYPSEDQLGWTVQTNGRIDVHGDSYIALGADAEHDYEARGSTTTQTQALKPVPYDTEGAYASGVYSVDRVRATLEGDFRNYSYFNVPQYNNGGQVSEIDESTRNFTQGRIAGRVDYAFTPDAAVSGKIEYAEGDYLNGAKLLKRNYNQERYLAGVNFDITALARGEIDLGYVDHSYTSPLFHNLSGFSATAKVEYFPTQLITVTLTGQRQVEDAAFSTAGGYFENQATLRADYEVRRNIIVSSLVGYEQDDFQGVNRTDDVTELELIGKFFVNRYVGLGANLSYTDRNSSGAVDTLGPEYDETRLTLSLTFQR